MWYVLLSILAWANVLSLSIAVIVLIWTVIARPAERVQALLILTALGTMLALTALLGWWWKGSIIISGVMVYILRDAIAKISGLNEAQSPSQTPAA